MNDYLLTVTTGKEKFSSRLTVQKLPNGYDMNYCLFIQTINMAIAIAAGTTASVLAAYS